MLLLAVVFAAHPEPWLLPCFDLYRQVEPRASDSDCCPFCFGMCVCVCVCECARARVCKCVFSSANIRTPALNVLLFVLQALLGAPEPEDPLDTSIAEMWKGDIAQAHATG